MDPVMDFDPVMVIRRKKFIVPDGEIVAIFRECNDGKFVITFLKNLELIKEVDVTTEWLSSKSVYQVDAFMNDFVKYVTQTSVQ